MRVERGVEPLRGLHTGDMSGSPADLADRRRSRRDAFELLADAGRGECEHAPRFARRLGIDMRWIIAAAVLFALAIGISLLIEAPDADPLPPGGRSVLYIGVVLVWGFVGVGSYAWLRRPDNATGKLMMIVGVLVGAHRLPVLRHAGAARDSALAVDTLSGSVLIHLLLAFPSGRVEGRWRAPGRRGRLRRRLAQLPGLLFTPCDADCTIDENPWMIADIDVLSAIFGLIQALCAARRDRRRRLSCCCTAGGPRIGSSAAGSSRCCCSARRSSCSASGSSIANMFGASVADVFQILFFARVRARAVGVPARAAAHALLPHRGRRARDRAARRTTRAASATRSPPSSATPTLEVAYWLPERGYVDGDGLPARRAGRRTACVTEIDHEGRCVGALMHAAVL